MLEWLQVSHPRPGALENACTSIGLPATGLAQGTPNLRALLMVLPGRVTLESKGDWGPAGHHAGYFFATGFFVEDGTLPPSLRASESAMATACFRLVTFAPEPLFSLPSLSSCIVAPTFSFAFSP